MILLEKAKITLASDLLLKINTLSDFLEIGREFTETIGNIVPYKIATFYTSDNFQNGSKPIGINVSNEVLSSYMDHYSEDYTKWLFNLSKSMVCRESDLCSEQDRINTDYYRHMYAPYHIHYAVIISLIHNNTFLGCCSLYRTKESGDFSDDEIFLLDLLKDHFALALYHNSSPQICSSTALRDFPESFSFTVREKEVIGLIATGLSNDEVCACLSISGNTLKSHLQSIYRKAGASGKIQLLSKLDILK